MACVGERSGIVPKFLAVAMRQAFCGAVAAIAFDL